MTTPFELITEDFLDETAAITSLVLTFGGSRQAAPKARLAASNSATLLLAATFEEFIRQMAKEYARTVVRRCVRIEDLPRKMAALAWKRTMEKIGKIKLDGASPAGSAGFGDARTKFSDLYDFCRGDLSKNIYDEMIHNDNNMRPGELNGLFNVSGISDIFAKTACHPLMLSHLGEVDVGKSGPRMKERFEDFFERRNRIAHSLNSGYSDGTNQILVDIVLFDHFAVALCGMLEAS